MKCTKVKYKCKSRKTLKENMIKENQYDMTKIKLNNKEERQPMEKGTARRFREANKE
jgi:hypothetical protein